MKDINLTQAALETLGALPKLGTQKNHRIEAYNLLGKIIGALIRQCRQNAGRSPEECAQFLQVEAQLLRDWEYGEQVPSLPHLELLTLFLTGYAGPAPEGEAQDRQPPADEYMLLRQRLIGVLLRAARESTRQSVEDLGASTALDIELLIAYEMGKRMIPVNHLTALAQAVERDLSDFIEPNGARPAPRASGARRPAQAVTPPDPQLFIQDGRNEAFIRLAMAFQQMDRQNLHRIVDALSGILKAREAEEAGTAPAS